MRISLDGIELPDLIIEHELSWTGVESKKEMTLGGVPVIWEQSYVGKPINLVGGETDADWITRETLIALQALASTSEATYSLIHEGTTTTVRFRNEDPPAIEATPIVARARKVLPEYYTKVKIKLMEVVT